MPEIADMNIDQIMVHLLRKYTPRKILKTVGSYLVVNMVDRSSKNKNKNKTKSESESETESESGKTETPDVTLQEETTDENTDENTEENSATAENEVEVE